MKQLRRTIRKILLENQSHESKLIELIATGDHENIIQALDLADAIGVIEITHQEEHGTEGNWRGSYNCKFTILSQSFADKLKEIEFALSKGYYLTMGSNTLLKVELMDGELWIRRDDHYSLEDADLSPIA